MKYIKLISILLIIISLIFLGCVQKPVGIPTPSPVKTISPATPVHSPTPEITSIVRNVSTYKVFVDETYGFKRVIETNYRPFEYKNLTLKVYAGDTVIWINDASDNEHLTIISEEKLWNNSVAFLRYNYDMFNYTFTKLGTYEVSIKEYPRVAHQKIIVSQ